MNTDTIVAALKEEAQLWLAADDHDFNRGIARAWLRLAENMEARLTPPPAPAPAAQAALASVPTRSCGHPAGCLDPAGRCRWCDDRKLLFKAGEAIERLGREYEATKKPAPASDWRGECEIRRSIMHDGYYASVFCGGKTWYLCEGNVWRHDPANDASENTQMFPSESAARAALDKADPPTGVEPASKETAFDAKVWAEKMVDCYPATPSAIGVGSLDRTVGASLFLPDFKKEVIVATMKDWRRLIAAALQSAYDAGRAAGMAVSP